MDGKKIIEGIFSKTENDEDDSTAEKLAIKSVSLGNIIAVAISWSIHKSILWAAFHGICSWFYIIYYAIYR